MPEL
jgi:hypothetical protein